MNNKVNENRVSFLRLAAQSWADQAKECRAIASEFPESRLIETAKAEVWEEVSETMLTWLNEGAPTPEDFR